MNDRDFQLLAILDAEDRAVIEETVDAIITDTLPGSEPAFLRAAAAAFEERGNALPDTQKITAWQIAAALRARIAPEFTLH